ncbi:1-deoxy-D-xylulose-5-phosphate reductoisomerase [Litorimonas sp. RW-G-Af-16]|uniref:1-deoxy-D-xylulose-5-phosphate reductoisomerase n=1 Tax=Litorimonas sp. RW-G-Af-16 TaxID=3241168 RepID=UPI00390C76F1
MTKRVTILGATGSIGENTLDIIRRAEAGTYQVVALTANQNAEALAAHAKDFNAEFVALADPTHAKQLEALLQGTKIEIGIGPNALIEAAKRQADFTMAAIIGAAGLEPTLAAVAQGNHVGLANKECLVCAGEPFMAAVRESGAVLLPVDSEHNAIFQVLESDQPKGVKRLILTASGGPFREKTLEDLQTVTRENALNHPVWSMGAKISIDSATLMNKGLELIEASYLFNRPSAEIDVIVHPQSIIHSMVEYIDGSVLAQLGSPDMRTPIAYALGWPARIAAPVERLDFTQISQLTFFAPDLVKFPALRLAREALEAGGCAPCVLNAANEQAVAAFLAGRIQFLDIARIVEATLEREGRSRQFSCAPHDVAAIIATDASARRTADDHIVTL